MTEMTEAEYEQALARIEALMDAKPGTPEEAELEWLCARVEAYEDEHYPIPAPSAVDAAEFRAEQETALPEPPEPSDEWKASVRELAAEYDKHARVLPPEIAALLFGEEAV